MADDLLKSMNISAAGMKAQGTRLRVVSENVANVNSHGTHPGDEPYRRKLVTFKNELDRDMNAHMVQVDRIHEDRGEFKLKYDPQHPAADENGYHKVPNVNTLIEMMDMREAQRSYDANLNVIKSSRRMLNNTLDILR
ncbi:flagellar basal body rod protein FlgC [Magnetospira sp. QH-2]|uniref:flagellar basal body rod protein FlgC n=1 Tax=Magnetospira sp. (strain QH-2) TaxID=1288970 RepID=UPI0003E816C6|nr:flagellar basal body rod protein FlgC [Magnetospira sp. QH-2]CCQ74108.1 flagellar basal-body rod protein FlgC [Magnetospira sp. QH-2]